MIYDSRGAISTLNTLIETCKDGENGFRAAELQAEVLRTGGHPEESGSVYAALRRGWMNVKAAVSGGDESAILSECEAGEDAAVKAYDDALNAALGRQQRDIIARQRAEVKEAHDEIHVLRDSRRAACRAARR